MKYSVLGCGRWGTYIAHYLSGLDSEVILWGRNSSKRLKRLTDTRANEYLNLNDSIMLTDNLGKAINHSDTIFISVSSQSLRSLAAEILKTQYEGKLFVLCMKGIENVTGLRLTQVVNQVCPDAKTAVWVGPGHVQNFINGIPSCMIIDSSSEEISRKLAAGLSSDLIRIYYGSDLIGTEIGAAAKNVVGIAAGMLDGLGYHSLKGALMARGASEYARLVAAMGGNQQTVYGLSHLGDYEATLFSPFSHNRLFGENFVKGEGFDMLAEGVTTVKSLVMLSEKYGVDLPISKAIYAVIYDGLDVKKGIMQLFSRPLKPEFR